MNGRVYDPAIGRFLSVDPVFQFPTNTQSLNPYSYVLNSPLSLTDPTGYESTGEEMQEGDSVAERDAENGGGNTIKYEACKSNCTNTMTVTVDKSGASGAMGQAGGQSVGSVSIEGAGSVGISGNSGNDKGQGTTAADSTTAASDINGPADVASEDGDPAAVQGNGEKSDYINRLTPKNDGQYTPEDESIISALNAAIGEARTVISSSGDTAALERFDNTVWGYAPEDSLASPCEYACTATNDGKSFSTLFNRKTRAFMDEKFSIRLAGLHIEGFEGASTLSHGGKNGMLDLVLHEQGHTTPRAMKLATAGLDDYAEQAADSWMRSMRDYYPAR